jgi:hypothetical protein
MREGKRFGLSAKQKADIWQRSKSGHSLHEACSILRDAVENVAHAHHIVRDPANGPIWLQKDDSKEGRVNLKKAFEDEKGTRLFERLDVLHSDC